jgi:hypothetical protein
MVDAVTVRIVIAEGSVSCSSGKGISESARMSARMRGSSKSRADAGVVTGGSHRRRRKIR